MKNFALLIFVFALGCSEDDGSCPGQKSEARDVLCDAIQVYCSECDLEAETLCFDFSPDHEVGDGCLHYAPGDDACIDKKCARVSESLIPDMRASHSCEDRVYLMYYQTQACFDD